jgi:nitroimidazol reductase NimA-like FMN-containing flavoprotein (pyridoxamine 5'-phosphate oxidase superfamily)
MTETAPPAPVTERLGEDECLRLISPGGIGRIGFSGRFGPAVLPVNYTLHQGAIVFRTGQDSPLGEDLRTGIAHAYYKVAFEIDIIDLAAREGWSVLIQGDAQPVDPENGQAELLAAGVEPWPAGEKELFVRIIPTRITGRRIHRPGPG